MQQPLTKQTLGAIAANVPGATAVFRRHRLDFCCGGERVLEEVAKAGDLQAILDEISELRPSGEDPSRFEPLDLIDHILSRYHETHRRELPELVQLAKKVEAVHRDHPDVPAGLSHLLSEMQEELETHMQKEEVILFPLMRGGANPMLGHPIARMRFEHDEHGARIRQIETLTHEGRLPFDACASWAALYRGIDKLIGDLMQHIHLENNVLFPQFAKELPSTSCCGSSRDH